MKGLDEDIKNGRFSSVYLLYGEEEYLKSSYKKRLLAAMTDPEDTMNFSSFEGKGIDPAAIIDLAETMPFFKDRRVILVENSGFFKNACDTLADYLKDSCPTTCFLFVEQEVERRGRMYKAVSAAGRAVEMVNPDQATLMKWAATVLKRAGKQVRPATLEKLFSMSGTDMNSVMSELNKLIDYTGERDVVEDSDVEAICTVTAKSRVFDMIDAIADGEQKLALELYYDLLSLKEPPMRILFLIARQFNYMLQMKELMAYIRDYRTIGERTGLKPFIAEKYANRARSFTYEQLRLALELCVEMEEAVKQGRMGDQLSVELLIVKLSGQH